MFFWWPIRFVPDIWTACIQNSRSCWFKSHVLTLPNQENMCSFRQPDIRPPSTLSSHSVAQSRLWWLSLAENVGHSLGTQSAVCAIQEQRCPSPNPDCLPLFMSWTALHIGSFRVRRSSIFRRSQESSRLLSFCIIRSKPLVLSLNI